MHRLLENPILTRRDVPDSSPELTDVSSVFNPGAAKIGTDTALLLRVQNRGRETFLLQARSGDGITFEVSPEPSAILGFENLGGPVYHVYDPRITAIGNDLFVTVSLDTDRGSRAVLARTKDLSTLELIGPMWDGDARNAVLFPGKIGGRFIGLVRPNTDTQANYVRSGSEIWLVESPDLESWKPVKPVLQGRWRYWDELIGSGPPPTKTREGWLHIYHGVATHFASANIYQAGVCLLKLDDPSCVIARGKYNILEPRTDYELVGQVPNVVFPTGIIVDSHDAEDFALTDSPVIVYYGAADTVVAAVRSTVGELLEHCHAGSQK